MDEAALREQTRKVSTYGGMPVVVDALRTYAAVLEERGEPFPADAPE
jgi:hypothetical protein